MRRDEVVVLANDVVPGLGMPVAAPGLRAWGIANGLRAHGHDVTVVVNRAVVERAWGRAQPPPRPAETILASPRQFGDLVRTRDPRAVVITNSNHVDRLGNLGDTRLVYDFFAPKMLELELQTDVGPRDLRRLEERKIRALRRSDAVIVNGAKKLPYVEEWLRRAESLVGPDRTAVVNMPLPAQAPAPPADGPVHAIVAGYIQPWSTPGDWAEVILPFLAEESLVLHLLVAVHWGNRDRASDPVPVNFARLVGTAGVVEHGPMEFDDFRRLLASCHLSIDLFDRNPERELAMVTRTAVSLSCGLPVVHVPFTETSELVRERGAGWLVEATDLDGIRCALTEAVDDREALVAKRRGAERVAREVLDPAVATEPLHRILEELG